MTGWQRLSIAAAGLSGAMAVGFAAIAAHGLDGKAADWIGRGAHFQLIHAVALLALGLGRGDGPWLKAAALLWGAGIILFSGALYVVALTGLPVTALVPVGGCAFILGWLTVMISAIIAI
jgi:uncharacterized membrane protein YgdD (TMEM256/DUF423 family)